MADVVYAKNFGVVADGTTDNLTALQNAIDAARTAGKTGVVLPSGTVLVYPYADPNGGGQSLPLILRSGVSLIGAGRGNTVLLGKQNPLYPSIKGDVPIVKIEGVVTPATPTSSTATTGGTLAAGTYSYRVSAVNAEGESVPSTAKTQVTTGTTSTVTVTWTPIARATGYKVYGRTGGSELLLATITSGATVTYTDTGATTPSGAMPTTNTSGAFGCGIYSMTLRGDSTATTSTTRVGYEQAAIKIDEFSGNLTIQDVWIDQVTCGMLSRGAQRIEIGDVLITNVYLANAGGVWGIGLWFWNGTTDVAVNNVIMDTLDNVGFLIDAGDPGFGARINHVTASGLTVLNFGKANPCPAIEIQGGRYCTITNFIVDGGTPTQATWGLEFSMDQTLAIASDNAVSNGTIANVGTDGMKFLSAQRNSVSGVRLLNHAATASGTAVRFASSAYGTPATCIDNNVTDLQVRAATTPANYGYGVILDGATVAIQRNRLESTFFGAPNTGTCFAQGTNVGSGANVNSVNEGDYAGPRSLRPTAAAYQTIHRNDSDNNAIAALSTGRLSLVAMELPAGFTIASISFLSGSTAANGPTNQLFGIYSSALALLATTANGTTGAWNANAIKTLSFSTPYTTINAGIYYLAIMVAASSAVPTLSGQGALASGSNSVAPMLFGSSTSSLTTTLPATAAAMTAINSMPYAYVS